MSVKIILNYQIKNEVSPANFNTYKRVYNWNPFLKRVLQYLTSVIGFILGMIMLYGYDI